MEATSTLDWTTQMEAAPKHLVAILTLANVLWVIFYVLAAKRGFQDKTYAVPLVSACGNLFSEVYYGLINPLPAPYVYVYWLMIVTDGIIMYQVLKYGFQKDFFPNLPKKLFYPTVALLFATMSGLVVSLEWSFRDYGWHSAMTLASLMSVLFVGLLLRRNNLEGQTLYSALTRGLGTGLAFYCFPKMFPVTPILIFMFIVSAVFDTIYTVMVYRKSKELGYNPWTRI